MYIELILATPDADEAMEIADELPDHYPFTFNRSGYMTHYDKVTISINYGYSKGTLRRILDAIAALES